MIRKLTLQLFTFVVISVVFCFSTANNAYAYNLFTTPLVISAHIQAGINSTLAFSEDDFTPQERQKIQALIQRRNKEISKILNSSQQKQLAHELHNGNNLDQALEAINLPTEERELVNSITVFTNLKLKGVISRHQLLDSHK